MKILITGGAGYVGSHVALEALFVGHEVLIYDNHQNSSYQVASFLGSIGAEILTADILDLKTLTKVMKQFRPDIVIHTAALKNVDESQSIPLQYYYTNVAGTLNVLMAMENANVNQIIFSSSAAVYGESEFPVQENFPLSPTSVYGKTKVACENMITFFAKRVRNAVSLRYFNPVASHPMLPERKPVALMGKILDVAAGRQPTLKIFGDGSAVRDFIHIRDVAAAHLFVKPQSGHKIYNIGTGRGVKVNTLVIMMEAVIHHEIQKDYVDPRPGDIQHSVANCDLINRETRWKPTRTLENMCRDAWETEIIRLSSEH